MFIGKVKFYMMLNKYIGLCREQRYLEFGFC